METKNIADSMNSNRSCNRTNDEFTSFGGIETQRICDEVKLTFKLKYNYNINKTIDNNEINCFMSTDKIPPKVIQKHDSRSLLEKSNDSSSELNNDSLVNDCDFDSFSSKSNNDSSYNGSILDDSDFDVNSYQFEIDRKYKNETYEYVCDPMLYFEL